MVSPRRRKNFRYAQFFLLLGGRFQNVLIFWVDYLKSWEGFLIGLRAGAKSFSGPRRVNAEVLGPRAGRAADVRRDQG